MQSKTLFEIKNLVCSYSLNKNEPALKIEDLTIEKGQLVFLLGASGSGKSTLLETLGLMNNTIADGELLFYQTNNPEPIKLSSLWEKGQEEKISKVRKDNYSFIFQNTNLMESFTAYQNVCLSKMIKEDKRELEVVESAKELMNRVKLPVNEVGLDTLAVNLSGGQRQRVAFVRALNTDFNILFGDEPTGNLDESNANELFEVIKSNLSDERSAIIVSHDINLAINHADIICVITKEAEKGYGEILKQNIIYRTDWEGKEEAKDQVKKRVRSLYKTNLDGLAHRSKNEEQAKTNGTYRELFFRKETKALLGKNNINLIVLSLILFFTFLAIGFANGSLGYLKKKLDSAFVNWLMIEIPHQKSDKDVVNSIYEDLNRPDIQKKFQYQKVSMFKYQVFFAWDLKRNGAFRIQGRTVDMENDRKLLNEFVYNKDNLLKGSANGFLNDQDLSLIVTERFLQEFNYAHDAGFIYINKTFADTSNRSISMRVPIPIRAVVKELPGQNQFLLGENLSKFWNQKSDNPFYINFNTGRINILFEGDSADAVIIKKSIKKYFAAHQEHNTDIYPIEAHKKSYKKGYDITAEHTVKLSYQDDTALYAKLLSLPEIKPYKDKLTRVYYYNQNFENSTLVYDEISVYFTKLDRIRDFSEYVLLNYNEIEDGDKIAVDTIKVKDKENFNFLSYITFIICYLLVLFASIAVGLFIFNMLKMHLNKVKMNIGTFKAIGMGNNESRNIYFKIIFIFIIGSIGVGILSAFGVGFLANYILTNSMTLDKDLSFFTLNHFNTYITILVILLSTIAISWITINKILSKSPGDLIYNR